MKNNRLPRDKIKTMSAMIEILRSFEQKKKKYILTNGCFDILHLGHIRYLQRAKEFANTLIVALNSDTSVKTIKGNDRPLLPEMERAEILASLECVDYVFIFDDPKLDSVLSALRPIMYAKGGDYVLDPKDAKPGKPAIVQSEREIIDSYGGKIVIIPSEKDVSTTNIIQSILSTYNSRN